MRLLPPENGCPLAKRPLQSQLLVPFGSKNWSPERATITTDEGGHLSFDCTVSHVVLDIAGEKGLRLNSKWYRLFNQPPMGELQTSRDQFDFIRGHLPVYCDVWGKHQQMFLIRYFDFIVHKINASQPILEEKLSLVSSLYNFQDWLLSAFLPLPQALVYVPDNPDDQTYADADMIRVPLLFWTGREAFVIFFVGSDTRSPRLTNTQKKLSGAGFTFLKMDQAALENG